MNQVTNVPYEESIVVLKRDGPGQSQVMTPKQKLIVWMEDIVSKFRKPGNIVADL